MTALDPKRSLMGAERTHFDLVGEEMSLTALNLADPRRGKTSANLAGFIDTQPSDFSCMFAR